MMVYISALVEMCYVISSAIHVIMLIHAKVGLCRGTSVNKLVL
jgi:hypothetical protein